MVVAGKRERRVRGEGERVLPVAEAGAMHPSVRREGSEGGATAVD